MTLAVFLVGLVGPLTARWIASMGLTLVTLAGLSAAIATLRSMLVTAGGSIPADGVQLAGLFGIWHCLGMVLGAVTFCVTWASTKGFWTLAKA